MTLIIFCLQLYFFIQKWILANIIIIVYWVKSVKLSILANKSLRLDFLFWNFNLSY